MQHTFNTCSVFKQLESDLMTVFKNNYSNPTEKANLHTHGNHGGIRFKLKQCHTSQRLLFV